MSPDGAEDWKPEDLKRLEHGAFRTMGFILEAPALFGPRRVWMDQHSECGGHIYFAAVRLSLRGAKSAARSAERMATRTELPVPFTVYRVAPALLDAAKAARLLLDMNGEKRHRNAGLWAAWLVAHAQLVCRWEPR